MLALQHKTENALTIARLNPKKMSSNIQLLRIVIESNRNNKHVNLNLFCRENSKVAFALKQY
jgi:hypothetical protein